MNLPSPALAGPKMSELDKILAKSVSTANNNLDQKAGSYLHSYNLNGDTIFSLKISIIMNKALPLFILLLFLAVSRTAAADDVLLPDAILYPERKAGHILVVDKAEQLLYLYRHDETGQVSLERVMQCSTGGNKGDKMVEGDKKTPNGFYIFNQKLLPRELPPIYGTLAYPSDYPNFWDKKLGRGGYGIWIHGINKPLVDYDSNGCVELENADIAQMEELIRLFDTPMITYESLVQAPASELQAEADRIVAFLETWRQAWVNKDHENYRNLYDPNFTNSDGRSFEGWMTHKVNVGRNYQKIHVEIKDLRIYRHRDVIVAVFTQDYRGDERFTSVGLKRLYLKNTGSGYKIVAETFRNSPESKTNKWLTAEEKRRALETPPLKVAKASTPVTGQNEPESSRVAVADDYAKFLNAVGRADTSAEDAEEQYPEAIEEFIPEAPLNLPEESEPEAPLLIDADGFSLDSWGDLFSDPAVPPEQELDIEKLRVDGPRFNFQLTNEAAGTQAQSDLLVLFVTESGGRISLIPFPNFEFKSTTPDFDRGPSYNIRSSKTISGRLNLARGAKVLEMMVVARSKSGNIVLKKKIKPMQ